MIDITLDVSGIKETADAVRVATKRLMAAVLNDGIDVLYKFTPVDKDVLRNHWEVTVNGQAVGDRINQGDFVLSAQLGIQNLTPYAARVNWGFVGTDSLGRNYTAANNPGQHFLERGIAEMNARAEELAKDMPIDRRRK
jgi:hypothetical protein